MREKELNPASSLTVQTVIIYLYKILCVYVRMHVCYAFLNGWANLDNILHGD